MASPVKGRSKKNSEIGKKKSNKNKKGWFYRDIVAHVEWSDKDPDTEPPVFIKLSSQVRPLPNVLYCQSVQNKSDG